MTAPEILQQLQKRQYAPIYWLHGDEPFYIDLVGNYIEKNALPEAERGFNQTVFYGKDSDLMTVLNAAKRFPMMTERQVVIVKEAQELDVFKGRASKDKEAKLEQLQAYLEKPLPSTVLVFEHKYGLLDKRLKLYKTIEKQAAVLESKKLYDNQLPQWVADFVQGKGYKIDPRAAQIVADYLGNDLEKISNELEKLMIGLAAGSTIGAKEIEQNIGISKEFNVFELQAALAKRDSAKCFQIAYYFAANPKSNPFVLTVGNLASYFSKIVLYHSLKDKSKGAVAGALKVNPYFVSDYETAARSYPLGKAAEVISLLRQYDLKSKGVDSTGNTDDGELLKELIFKILN